MVSKIKPIPLRLSDEVRANIKAQAEAQGRSAHSLIVAAVEREYGAGAATPAAPALGATLKAAKASRAKAKPKPGMGDPTPSAIPAPIETMHAGDLVPLAGTFQRQPLQKAPKRSKWNV